MSTVPEEEEEEQEEEAISEAAAIQSNKENSYFDLGQYNQSKGKVGNAFHGYENFTSYSDGSGAGLKSTTMGNEENNEEINYCSDDVFSSFLNSLINEDAFAVPPPFSIITGEHDHDHDRLPSVTNASSNGWESATNVSSAFNQKGRPRVDDPVE